MSSAIGRWPRRGFPDRQPRPHAARRAARRDDALSACRHSVGRRRRRSSPSSSRWCCSIACANVANLLLARATTRRQRDRGAAGRSAPAAASWFASSSSRARCSRLLGGVVGLAIAYWARLGLLALRPPFLPPDALSLSASTAAVLAFTAIVALLTGLVFGLAPALQLLTARSGHRVEGSQPGSSASSRLVSALRNALVVAQVALSCVALVGAGLFLRSLGNARRIDPGIRQRVAGDGLASTSARPRPRPARRRELRQRECSSGVRGLGWRRGRGAGQLRAAGRRRVRALRSSSRARTLPTAVPGASRRSAIVSADYFATTGVEIVRGRGFAATDHRHRAAGRRRQRDDGQAVLARPGRDRQAVPLLRPADADRSRRRGP